MSLGETTGLPSYSNDCSSSDSNDALEKTLMLAAAAADSRSQNFVHSPKSRPENAEDAVGTDQETLEDEDEDYTGPSAKTPRNLEESNSDSHVFASRTPLKTASRKPLKKGPHSSDGISTSDGASSSPGIANRTPDIGKRSYDIFGHPRDTPNRSFDTYERSFDTSNRTLDTSGYSLDSSSASLDVSSPGLANVVANHYNKLEEKGLDERSRSRIFHMRNFHNWIKSMMINEYLTKIKDGKLHNAPVRVMDMCCGKGGDLLKWRKNNITHLICTDIAAVSLDQCKTRYEDMKRRDGRDRNAGKIYSIEYIPADCTRARLRKIYRDPSMKLDLVSCQFAFHYSFESLPQAECMFRNASECLQAGGYFIGTMPDSYDLIARAKKAGGNSFGNDVYQVVFECDMEKPPFFGAKYNFHLDGVVDCPEFLVYFPVFVKLAKKFGLKLVRKEKFYELYERMKQEGGNLLTNMNSLEMFPASEDKQVGSAPDDYDHAKEFLKQQNKDHEKIGTLSKSEWEASSLYLAFVFEKVKNTWNADGTPCFDI